MQSHSQLDFFPLIVTFFQLNFSLFGDSILVVLNKTILLILIYLSIIILVIESKFNFYFTNCSFFSQCEGTSDPEVSKIYDTPFFVPAAHFLQMGSYGSMYEVLCSKSFVYRVELYHFQQFFRCLEWCVSVLDAVKQLGGECALV